MVSILQKDDPILRQEAKDVPVGEIGSKKIQKIIADMKTALETQDDGVAIAAPQIGKNLRIFVMSKRVFEIIKQSQGTNRKAQENQKINTYSDVVFINPKITKMSKEKEASEEGCLSVRYLYGKVMRSKKATVEALDENGKKFISGGSGIIAQIFQHECDHLDGILFIDKAKELQEIIPEEIRNSKSQITNKS